MSEEEAAGPSTDLYRRSEHKRSNSPTPSDVSLRSDRSQPQPLNFNSENPGWNEPKRSNSPTASNTSLKSDRSKGEPLNFNKEDPGNWSEQKRSDSPTPSNISLKSDRSKDELLNFNEEDLGWSEHNRSDSSTSSNISLKSDRSRGEPLNFHRGDPRWNEPKRSNSPTPRNTSLKSDRSKGEPLNFNKGDPGTLEPSSFSASSHGDPDDPLNFLAEASSDSMTQEQDSSKDNKKKQTKKAFKNQLFKQFENELKNCDTEIYEIKDGKINTKGPLTFDKIFKKSARTVLLQGVAGIGKTFQAKRFMAEWGKDKTNKDIDFIVPLNFRELKTERGKNQSMNDLIRDSIADQSRGFKLDDCKLAFIIDSFEKLNLDFKNNEDLTDMKKPASVEVLLTSLIKGKLLPSAHVWIISRSEAVNKIPAEFINRVTECRDTKKKLTEILKTWLLSQFEELKKSDTEIYDIKDGKINTKGPSTFADIFKKSAETVLLQGVAGIGKTFQAKRFMVEWGKGKTNKDIDFVVPLNFSELKTGGGKNQSMNDLFCRCINVQKQGAFMYDNCKLVFVIDGFEKLNLDFKNNKHLTDMEKPASVEVLLTNLIRRNLLSSAHVWIISRPEAVNKIPAVFINRVTECQETSLRWEKLTSALKQSLKGENITTDINDPKVKNTEHTMRENESSEVNGEETKSQVISLSKLFKEAKGQTVRTVLTVGEAGIGKSCCVQRFIKDWANESKSFFGQMWDSVTTWLWKAKEAEPLIFPLNISELNQMRRKTEKKNLMELLNHFFKETKKYVISDIEQLKVIFILDGLDVYQPPLDLDNNSTVNDVRTPASVDDLLANLIKGTLFRSARIWITSRQKLSHECISRTTEIRWKPDYASQQMLKSQMKEQLTLVSEGIDKQKASAVLKDIYTDLYIIEGDRGEVNQLNEVKQAQDAKFKPVTEETSIKYHDIFKPAANQAIRTVLTMGLAGIGKTFATMKYMLDWAEGERHGEVFFMFSLSFRELNLRKDEKHSLEGLIQSFYPGMKTSEIKDYDQYKMLIVLDGFDECRLELDFTKTPNHPRNVKDEMDVNDLLTNLIQGNLLPKAQIWITSRPAASNNIPAAKVDRVTEVRGFNEEQKEEYFRKRFSDKELAERILTHLKKSRSLYIMCHIPVFCWITSTVLEDLFQRNEEEKMPKTLTDMYIYFLLLQCKQANVKYGGDEPGQSSESDSCWNVTNRKVVTSLGRLAFEALEEGNLVFTEDDLTKCGVDVTEVAGVSGLLTQIKRETSDLYPQKMFCFVHLSIQEFLAAFYVFYMFNNEGHNLLTKPVSEVGDSPAYEFYKMAVDKALGSKNGDWDLFIRFLLGLSLETNQKLFQELLTQTKSHTETNKKTIEYIKEKIKEENSDPDQNCNLFHCLNELNDHTLVKEIKEYLSSDTVNFENFTKSQWSALTFVLLTSDENLDVFDLKKYLKSEKVLLGMLPVVKVCQKALLSWCELSEESCLGLSSSVLSYASSNLTELDLSHNDLKDSGVEKLADGLKSIHCKLEILKLAGCQVSEEGCSSLASALTSKAASSLKLLDLSYNDPGDKWKTKLTAIADDSHNSLKTLCLDRCGKHCLQPGLKKYGVDLWLDRNTASRRLKVLEGDRTATTKQTEEERLTRRHSEEGFKRTQVSCGEGLKGLCYWEVKWKGSVGIAVAYGNVSNEWDSSGGLGCNDMSWSLRCSDQGYSALHGKSCKKINMECYDKIAVFLDWEGGTLTYYGVKEGKLSLIHKFTEKFTEPLIPCFWFKRGIVTLCEI